MGIVSKVDGMISEGKHDLTHYARCIGFSLQVGLHLEEQRGMYKNSEGYFVDFLSRLRAEENAASVIEKLVAIKRLFDEYYMSKPVVVNFLDTIYRSGEKIGYKYLLDGIELLELLSMEKKRELPANYFTKSKGSSAGFGLLPQKTLPFGRFESREVDLNNKVPKTRLGINVNTLLTHSLIYQDTKNPGVTNFIRPTIHVRESDYVCCYKQRDKDIVANDIKSSVNRAKRDVELKRAEGVAIITTLVGPYKLGDIIVKTNATLSGMRSGKRIVKYNITGIEESFLTTLDSIVYSKDNVYVYKLEEPINTPVGKRRVYLVVHV